MGIDRNAGREILSVGLARVEVEDYTLKLAA
jgi:hypothetical protein